MQGMRKNTSSSRHQMHAPVDRMFADAWLYRHPFITCQKISEAYQRPTVSESMLCLVVRSSVHPCPVNRVAIGRAVVFHAHAFSARIKYQHCRCPNHFFNPKAFFSISLKTSKGRGNEKW